ncbi:hypothetical protein LZ31DRAFT_554560 [Colletotrichum somersetense]|nr:hypothetical protein LZ31DRAFT_554560 [Colletotrichum somersetense]
MTFQHMLGIAYQPGSPSLQRAHWIVYLPIGRSITRPFRLATSVFRSKQAAFGIYHIL